MEYPRPAMSGTWAHLSKDLESGNIFIAGDTYTLILDFHDYEERIKDDIERHGVKVQVKFEREMATPGRYAYEITFLEV